jgi:hypothetical protein
VRLFLFNDHIVFIILFVATDTLSAWVRWLPPRTGKDGASAFTPPASPISGNKNDNTTINNNKNNTNNGNDGGGGGGANMQRSSSTSRISVFGGISGKNGGSTPLTESSSSSSSSSSTSSSSSSPHDATIFSFLSDSGRGVELRIIQTTVRSAEH